jgi:polar amino acid transport system substrate-binding protein
MTARVAVLAVLLSLGAAVAASRPLDDIRARGVIELCAHPNALPFARKAGPPRGVQIDLAEELARRLDVALVVRWVTVGFQYRAADCDIVMDAIVDPTALQERELRWSEPYQRSGVALAVRPGLAAAGGFAGLPSGTRVGVQLGSVAQTLLGKRGLTTIPFGFEDEMMAALAAGEIDAAAVTPISIGWWNHTRPDAAVTLVHAYDDEPELRWDLAVGMRRSDRFLRREIDRVIETMLADGAVARIYADYGIEHRPPGKQGPVRITRVPRVEEECVRLGQQRECSPSR